MGEYSFFFRDISSQLRSPQAWMKEYVWLFCASWSALNCGIKDTTGPSPQKVFVPKGCPANVLMFSSIGRICREESKNGWLRLTVMTVHWQYTITDTVTVTVSQSICSPRQWVCDIKLRYYSQVLRNCRSPIIHSSEVNIL